MSFQGQINFGYPITSQNIITDIPDNAVLPLSMGSSLQGNILGVTFGDLKSQVSSPSVIAVNGTSLYSTNPLAGPINPDNNIALGSSAGTNATNAFASVLLGTQAGYEATNIVFSNFIGNATGGFAINVVNSNFIGNSAGYNAPNASQSNFFGFAAGTNAVSANNSNFIGQNAGTNAALANNSNFLGKEAGMNSSGNNVNAFGNQAHKGGSLSGQTVFANATLPSYVNRAAATTAINVPNGAVAGSTYLYYNQTTFAIEAVRL